MHIPPEKVISWVARHFEYKQRANGWLVIANPWGDNDKLKFNISPKSLLCHDWRGDDWCGRPDPRTGLLDRSFLKFVCLYKKCSVQQALEDIFGRSVDPRLFLQGRSPPPPVECKEEASVALPAGARPITSSTDPQAAYLKNWLYKRGYTNETIASNNLYHCGMSVVWPYYEFEEIVYWQSRSRADKIFRFPPTEIKDSDGNVIRKFEFSKSDFLYGFDQIELSSYLIITESIFCQVTLGEQALASGGAALPSSPHALVYKKLKLLGPQKGIILAPDNDEAGLKSIISNYRQLKGHGFKLYYTIPPKIKFNDKITKDWNELFQYLQMSTEEIRNIHDKNIKLLNELEINRLCGIIHSTQSLKY